MNIIFDLDGTLINSFHRHYVVLFDALLQCKIDRDVRLDENDFLNYKKMGRSTEDYLNTYSNLSEREVSDVISYWKQHIEDERYLMIDNLYDDTINGLLDLKLNNEIYYLSSRSNTINLLNEIEWLGIKEHARACYIVSPPNSTRKKKDILKTFNKQDSVFVGDTEMDYQASIYSGIPFVALNRGFRNKLYWDKLKIESYDSLEAVKKTVVMREEGINAQHEQSSDA